jgi:hypothetical protein
MAVLPDVTVSIADGAQGLVDSSPEQVHAVIGTCSKGTANTLYSFASIPALVAALGVGPAVEAAAHSLAVSGGPVYVVRVSETTAGIPGSVTQAGSGPTVTAPALTPVTAAGTSPPTVTLSGTVTRYIDLVVEITLGGARGTATFQYSLDGGATYSADIATAATYLMGDTGVTLNFATGTDYDTDNVYTAKSCIPNDAYEVEVEIVAGGALGTATFRYSLDALNPDGPTWSETFTTPTSGLYTLGDSGVTLTLAAGTYVADTTYSLACTAPAFTTTTMGTAFAALTADPREWGCVHVVGQASSAANSKLFAAALDVLLEAAGNNFRFTMGLIEAFDDTDGNLISAFSSFSSKRVGVAAGFARITSVISGRFPKRSAAMPIAARFSKVGIGTDLARVADGSLPGVVYLHRDEQVTPALDAARFSTLRTIIGRQGPYITNARLMAPSGSDFLFVQFRRVMDRGCQVGRNALLEFLNDGVRVNANGTIYELDARGIEAYVESALNAALTQPGHVTSVGCVIDRTNNVQSTQQINAQVRIRPLGYAKDITLDIGFTSPALVLA